MKLVITIVLVSITCFLFAQNDTAVKGIPVKIGKDGKVIVGVKPVVANTDSTKKITFKVDTSKMGGFASMTDTFREKTFYEKCKYFILLVKYKNPFIFWTILVLLGLWVLKMIGKLFDR